MAAAADVPGKFDVVLNGEGYRFLDEEQRSAYGVTPTFLPRQNVQGNYGDNQQDFWLTVSQNDWSLGEGQRNFRGNDDESSRMYYKGDAVDITKQGEVTAAYIAQTPTSAPGEAVRAACPRSATARTLVAAGATKLFTFNGSGTTTDHGAHGLGAAPYKFGLCTDGTDVYMSTTGSGTVGVRKWDGSSFSTFSASPADSLAFLNNTLYGFRTDTAKLVKWDTSGVQSDVYQWKQADGGAATVSNAKIIPYGAKLAILISEMAGGSELWIHDGVAPSLIAQLPANFYGYDMCSANGILFVGGSFVRGLNASTLYLRPAIMYVANGTLGLLWQSESVSSGASTLGTSLYHVPVAPWQNGLLFYDVDGNTAGGATLRQYHADTGAISSIATVGSTGDTPLLATTSNLWINTTNTTTPHILRGNALSTSCGLKTSLIDFDSSLTKYFKSVKIEGETGGDSVTIRYRLDTLSGNYTDVTTTAAMGTEYAIGAQGRAISISVGFGSNTVLRRIYVRAAPIQDTFKRRQYLLALGGVDGESPILLRDNTPHTKDGRAMAQDLFTAAAATTPFSITDKFGTFTGLLEPDKLEITEVRPDVYVARVTVREV